MQIGAASRLVGLIGRLFLPKSKVAKRNVFSFTDESSSVRLVPLAAVSR